MVGFMTSASVDLSMLFLFFWISQQKLIKRLQGVQNSSAHILCCERRCDHITPILQGLHWFPVEKHTVFKCYC